LSPWLDQVSTGEPMATDTVCQFQSSIPFEQDGEEKTWPEWNVEMTNYARRHGETVSKFLQTAADQTEPCLWEDMSEEARAVASKIMSAWALRTSGRARRRRMTNDLNSNGFEA
jgi:hypothetical protein